MSDSGTRQNIPEATTPAGRVRRHAVTQNPVVPKIRIYLELTAAVALAITVTQVFAPPALRLLPARSTPQNPAAGLVRKVVDAANRAVPVEPDTNTDTHTGPDTMVVLVESDPPEATVSLNGEERGHTPAMFDVPCAKPNAPFKIHVDLPGFVRFTQTMNCEPEGKGTVHAVLKSAPGKRKKN